MSQQEQVKVCPLCQHENELDAVQCEKCGAPLISTPTTLYVTDTLSAKPETVKPAEEAEHQPIKEREPLALHVAGEVQPIIVKNKDKIVLGRHVQGEPPPTIDLTAYHGHLLGVSRRHAMISISQDGYTIEDLNSSNGTWLNEMQLAANKPHVLRAGDQIRLGQLILFVYIPKTGSEEKPSAENEPTTDKKPVDAAKTEATTAVDLANKDNLASKSNLTGKGDLASKSNPASNSDLASKSDPVSKDDLASKSDLTDKGDLASKSNPASKGDPAGKSDPASKIELPVPEVKPGTNGASPTSSTPPSGEQTDKPES